MHQPNGTETAPDRENSAPTARKAWVRPTVSLIAASSAENGIGPAIDGGDFPHS
jgi:hypothetical protein